MEEERLIGEMSPFEGDWEVVIERKKAELQKKEGERKREEERQEQERKWESFIGIRKEFPSLLERLLASGQVPDLIYNELRQVVEDFDHGSPGEVEKLFHQMLTQVVEAFEPSSGLSVWKSVMEDPVRRAKRLVAGKVVLAGLIGCPVDLRKEEARIVGALKVEELLKHGEELEVRMSIYLRGQYDQE